MARAKVTITVDTLNDEGYVVHATELVCYGQLDDLMLKLQLVAEAAEEVEDDVWMDVQVPSIEEQREDETIDEDER